MLNPTQQEATSPTCTLRTPETVHNLYDSMKLPGTWIAILACAGMAAAATMTEDLNLGGYAPYALALAPLINSLFAARSSENTTKTITNGTAESVRMLALMSTGTCYGVVNAGHQFKIPQDASIPLKIALSTGSVGLNVALNMAATGAVVKGLPELPEYLVNLKRSEQIALLLTLCVSGILAVVGATPMMTAVVDATEENLGLPYAAFKGSNNILYMIDIVLTLSFMMTGFIAFGQWTKSFCITPSETEKLENTAKTLESIVGNPDTLPRFLTHISKKNAEKEEGDEITLEEIEAIIKNMTEFQSDSYCSALFYKSVTMAFFLAVNAAFGYITASEITAVGAYEEELGFIAKIPQSLLWLLNSIGLDQSIGETNASAFILNAGNVLFPLVGGVASFLAMSKVIADRKILTPTSIAINIIAGVLGLLSIGTILAMGAGASGTLGMIASYMAAISPFFLNTVAAPREMWGFVPSTPETIAQNKAIEQFSATLKEAKSTFYQERRASSEDQTCIATYNEAIKNGITTLTSTLLAPQPTLSARAPRVSINGEGAESVALLIGASKGSYGATAETLTPNE